MSNKIINFLLSKGFKHIEEDSDVETVLLSNSFLEICITSDEITFYDENGVKESLWSEDEETLLYALKGYFYEN